MPRELLTGPRTVQSGSERELGAADCRKINCARGDGREDTSEIGTAAGKSNFGKRGQRYSLPFSNISTRLAILLPRARATRRQSRRGRIGAIRRAVKMLSNIDRREGDAEGPHPAAARARPATHTVNAGASSESLAALASTSSSSSEGEALPAAPPPPPLLRERLP